VPEGVINSIGLRLAFIPAGAFRMGSPENEKDRNPDETLHPVELTRAFYLGVYPVTQEGYEKVMGHNPSWFAPQGAGKSKVTGLDTRQFPVEMVSWDEALEFCDRLSQLPEERQAGRQYRLPTEAEWEYACRAGAATHAPFHYGRSLSSRQANFDGSFPYGGAPKGDYLKRTTAVGSYPPNAWGLHDLHGNVWEWCHDWFSEHYYLSDEAGRDPHGPAAGTDKRRVLRGGSWNDYARYCRTAHRARSRPRNRRAFIGFRVALTVGT
jgi:formylglycine-generating enzyme required for sulfatase activity